MQSKTPSQHLQSYLTPAHIETLTALTANEPAPNEALAKAVYETRQVIEKLVAEYKGEHEPA